MADYIVHYMMTALQLLIYVFFAQLFLKYKHDGMIRIIVIICLISIPIPFINSQENITLNLVSSLVATFVVAKLLFQGTPMKIMAMSLVIAGLNVVCELATVFISSLILGYNTETIIEQNIFGIIYSLIVLLVFFTIICVVRIGVIRYRRSDGENLATSIRTVLLPVMAIILGYYIMYSSFIQPNKALSIIGLSIFVAFIIVNVTISFGTENDLKKYELKADLEAMQLQEEYNIETIRQLEQSYDELSRQAHDFRNQLICINGMIQKQKGQADLDEADRYVMDLARDIIEVQRDSEMAIKNTALRVIIRRTKERCKELSIRLQLNIHYSDFSFMDFKDICTFFANAFDNAIGASRQIPGSSPLEKLIDVEIRISHAMVHIRITNTHAQPIVENDAGLISTKSGPFRMGIGTKNMRRSIERYGGVFDFATSESIFETLASLPIPDEDRPDRQEK